MFGPFPDSINLLVGQIHLYLFCQLHFSTPEGKKIIVFREKVCFFHLHICSDILCDYL
jgi:hypothetical protein